MKKFVSLFLAVFIFVGVMAYPVSAASTDDSIFINILDYCFPNNGNSYSIYYQPGTVVNFNSGIFNNYHYIDILFFSDVVPSYVNIKTNGYLWQNLQVYNIGDQMYRAFGKFDEDIQSYIQLEFGVSSFAYITFFNMNVGTMQHNYIGEISAMNLVSAGITQSGSMSAANNPLTLSLPAPISNSVGAYEYNVLITENEWYKYDYLEFYLDVRSLTIDSFFCRIGSVDVSYSTNYFNGLTPGYNMWPDQSKVDGAAELRYIQVRVDLTNIDHTLAAPLSLGFNGTVSSFANDNMVTLFSVNGIIDQSLDSPFLFFFKRIWDRLDSGFNLMTTNLVAGYNSLIQKFDEVLGGDTTSGDEFQDQIATESDNMEEINEALESVTQPTIGDINIQDDPLLNDPQLQGDVTSWAHWIFESYFFERFFAMVIIFATARFVLFGKD